MASCATTTGRHEFTNRDGYPCCSICGVRKGARSPRRRPLVSEAAVIERLACIYRGSSMTDPTLDAITVTLTGREALALVQAFDARKEAPRGS